MSLKPLIITVVLCWVVFQLSGLLWSSKKQAPTETLARLLEPPSFYISDPRQNGFFYLLGIGAAPSVDPAEVGYDIWHEADARPAISAYDYGRPGRTDPRIALLAPHLSQIWETDDPLREIRRRETAWQKVINHQSRWLVRYEHWLGMKFEDRGFAHRPTPRFEEILTLHRLYLADGFARRVPVGMERLQQDLTTWRLVLREAKTISMKVMAQVVITDDVTFLSKLLARPTIDKSVMSVGLVISTPLTPAEHSLGWPIRHQLALGVQKDRVSITGGPSSDDADQGNERWLAEAAALSPQAFRRIQLPASHSFLGIPLQIQPAWETYAGYYDSVITATDSGRGPLPTFREAVRTNHGIFDSLLNTPSFEPDWSTFFHQLMETDTRLRLTSLQIVLRRPSVKTSVPNRLAEIGSNYFDPFTGLPMLWSSTQKKIYSVGKDRFDDGGDPTFDISVPALVTTASTIVKSRPGSATPHRTTR